MPKTDVSNAQQPTSGEVQRFGTVQLKKGDLVPSISMPSTSGRSVDLAVEADQKHLVLFFYPGDTVGQRGAGVILCLGKAHIGSSYRPRKRHMGIAPKHNGLGYLQSRLRNLESKCWKSI